MSIALTCDCNHSLVVGDEFAGKLIGCPSCSSVLRVPMPIQDSDLIDEPPVSSPSPRSAPMPVVEFVDEGIVAQSPISLPRPKPPTDQAPDDDPVRDDPRADDPSPDGPPPRSRADEPRRRERRRRPKSIASILAKPLGVAESSWSNANGGVIGGGITMLIGIVLLLALLPMGAVSLAGVALVTIGAIATVKGLMDLY